MSTGATSPETLAIRCIRPDLTKDRNADEQAMNEIGELLGYTVGEVVEIVPSAEGPLVTVMNALARTKAQAVIAPNWEHLYGIDRFLRDVARLISVASERTRQWAGVSPMPEAVVDGDQA